MYVYLICIYIYIYNARFDAFFAVRVSPIFKRKIAVDRFRSCGLCVCVSSIMKIWNRIILKPEKTILFQYNMVMIQNQYHILLLIKGIEPSLRQSLT